MRAILTLIILISTIQYSSAQENPASQLLFLYYNLKDALVAGNRDLASSKAEAFVKTAGTIDSKVIAENNIAPLVKDAGKIAETKDLKKQREYFIDFSSNMATVAKAVKLVDKPVYLEYCPMKKAYWLSSEKVIKNPYYGNSMLGCGEVKETIKF